MKWLVRLALKRLNTLIFRDQLEEEQEARADLQRLLNKAQSEAAEWRRKCESGEGGVRSEELEDLKRKLNNKLIDAESELESAQAKINQLEKAKSRLAGELEDVMVEVERVSKNVAMQI